MAQDSRLDGSAARRLDGSAAGCWLLAAGCWLLAAGCAKLDSRVIASPQGEAIGSPLTFSFQLSAFSFQLSAFSFQLSAFSP
jgi:hypothetical protein